MTAVIREQFDGLLNFRKPTGITSAKALYKVRAVTHIRKSGHAGTLDPAADGVLLLCMGKGTKRVERLMNLPKVYHAIGRLDVTSYSFDSDSPHEAVEIREIPSQDEVVQAAAHLQSVGEQIPPAVSAVKVAGVRSYELARRGQSVTLKPRAVRIDRLEILRYEWPEIEFEVTCGRGTYIRAIIRDLGNALGIGGCLTQLTRTAVGPFTIEEGTSLEELQQGLFQQRRVALEQLDHLLDEYAPQPAPEA